MASRGRMRIMERLRIAPDAAILYQHKPYGFLSPSTSPEGNKKFALDLLTRKNNVCSTWVRDQEPQQVTGLRAAGRLDADSTGLMLWSDDKALVEHVIGHGNVVEKEYIVRVTGHDQWTPRQFDETLAAVRDGMTLDGQVLKRVDIKRRVRLAATNQRVRVHDQCTTARTTVHVQCMTVHDQCTAVHPRRASDRSACPVVRAQPQRGPAARHAQRRQAPPDPPDVCTRGARCRRPDDVAGAGWCASPHPWALMTWQVCTRGAHCRRDQARAHRPLAPQGPQGDLT
jgi:pseudouridine synthase